MSDSEIGFAPIKIDSGEEIHVISGVSGQLLKVDENLNPIAEISQPFPAMITSSTIVGDKWIGIWVCLLYTSPSPRDATLSRMPSSA